MMASFAEWMKLAAFQQRLCASLDGNAIKKGDGGISIESPGSDQKLWTLCVNHRAMYRNRDPQWGQYEFETLSECVDAAHFDLDCWIASLVNDGAA